MKKCFTIETRIWITPDFEKYFNDFIIFYNKIYRYAWQEITSTDYSNKYSKKSEFNTHLCQKYNILKRTANAIINDVNGRLTSLKELKKTELSDLKEKVKALKKRKELLANQIEDVKPIVAMNLATQKILAEYRLNKQSYYFVCNKLDRVQAKRDKLQKQIKEKKYVIRFGTNRLFKKQYNLKANGYKNHNEWYQDFIANRDKNVFYFGSSDEPCGNQLARLSYDKDKDVFSLTIRKENNFFTGDDKYLTISNINFKYMRDELKYALLNGNEPLHYRFKRTAGKWYLQCIFNTRLNSYTTNSLDGVIGIDFNDGFLAITETDKHGNIKKISKEVFKYHGCGNKAKTEMEKIVKGVVENAVKLNKSIAIEDLDFKTKKASTIAGVNRIKSYNKMLHTLDFSRFRFLMENKAFKLGLELLVVDPAYTSYIGKNKYAKTRKLNIHTAAAYVIARRGQNFKDKI